MCHAASARADELEDFEQARESYERGRYDQAIERFDALVGGETPRLRSAPLVLESRKYLAAAYLFVGKRKKAEQQLELLLSADPSYQLDPVAFPREMQELFASVRTRLQEEREAQEKARQQRLQTEVERQAELERREARIRALEELAKTEVVRHDHSRWIAMIPFGIGQFQNGHRRLGLTLAITEGAMLAASLTTYFLHRAVVSTDPGGVFHECPLGQAGAVELCTRLDRRRRAYKYTNWVATSLLAGLAVYGILDAQLRFVPYTEEKRERPLPPEDKPELSLGMGPTSVHLRLRF